MAAQMIEKASLNYGQTVLTTRIFAHILYSHILEFIPCRIEMGIGVLDVEEIQFIDVRDGGTFAKFSRRVRNRGITIKPSFMTKRSDIHHAEHLLYLAQHQTLICFFAI